MSKHNDEKCPIALQTNNDPLESAARVARHRHAHSEIGFYFLKKSSVMRLKYFKLYYV